MLGLMRRLRTTLRGMTLLLAGICLGCGAPPAGSSHARSEGDPPRGRRVDPRAIDLAIERAAAKRGEPAEIRLAGVEVSGADLRRIGHLASLRELDLGTQPLAIGDDDLLALSDLGDLQVLVLGAAPITDRGLAALRGMRELNRLNVTGTRVTDEGLAVLAELPQLTSLR